MFPIYIERPQTQLSLSDYIHLQALLAEEQAEREHRLLQEYKKQQEQRRIQRAMHKLQVLTELQRRRQLEEQAIAAYYEAKEQERKRQLLERQRQFLLQQQQQEYYAALRHKQQQELQDQYLHWVSGQKSANDINPNQALAASKIEHQESETEEEEEEEDFYHDQLASLVRLIFGAQECKNNQQESKEKQPHAEQVEKQVQAEQETEEKVLQDEEELSDAEQEYTDDDEEEEEEDEFIEEEEEYSKREQEFSNNVENKPEGLIETQDQVMTLDEFVDYIHNKAQCLDEVSEKENSDAMEEDTPMEEDNTLPAMEHIDDNESMDEEVQVPSLVRSEAIHDLVNEILTNSEEEFTQFPDEDPVKIAKYDALNRIEQELNEIRQKHENNILNATLDFSRIPYDERSVSPDNIIAATTVENRELLNYEDQVMKILLKLDMINSDGDESIRNERKNLVKRAEEILDKLDEFKLKEWEKASCSSNSCIDEEL
ncbi:hypothetical protein BD770DRAFT_391452 [Pilaira anomala]|nr:hypothetical protein BD770DRAFT_391452 [Pilaira anomala]